MINLKGFIYRETTEIQKKKIIVKPGESPFKALSGLKVKTAPPARASREANGGFIQFNRHEETVNKVLLFTIQILSIIYL